MCLSVTKFIFVVQLLLLLYVMVEFLSNHVSTSLCCQVPWNEPEAFRISIYSIQLQAPACCQWRKHSWFDTANKISSLWYQHQLAGFMADAVLWLEKQSWEPERGKQPAIPSLNNETHYCLIVPLLHTHKNKCKLSVCFYIQRKVYFVITSLVFY